MAYFKTYRSLDPFYDLVDVAIWSTIEPGLAITAGSIATLTPLYRAIVGTLGFLTLPSKSNNTPRTGKSGASKDSRPPVSDPFHKRSINDYHQMKNLNTSSSISHVGVLESPEKGWPLAHSYPQYGENDSQEQLNKRQPLPDLEMGVRDGKH